MKKNNTLNMKSLIKEMNDTSRFLRKGGLFEDFGMNERPNAEEEYYQGEQGGEEMMGDEMEQEQGFDEQTVDVINQIRELAIQGIAQYANDVESEQYRALKRIWLETDKFYESINGSDDKK